MVTKYEFGGDSNSEHRSRRTKAVDQRTNWVELYLFKANAAREIGRDATGTDGVSLRGAQRPYRFILFGFNFISAGPEW